MKILIYGHRGWIGQQVLELLTNHNVILGNSRCDNVNDIENEIKQHNPTHIMSFIGRTQGGGITTIDYLEQKGKLVENLKDNLLSPITLALTAQKYGIHYTYLGTGCIFEYDNDHPFGKEENGFTDEDKPNYFGSSYSIVKGVTDQLMHLLEINTLNLRIRMPITDKIHPRNFITKITTYERICSVPNSMSVLNDLLPIMIDMAEKKLTGTYNFTNEGLISHNEILELYKKYIDNDFTWTNFSIEEQSKILASGRSNNYLDTTKLQQLYPIKNIKQSVEDIMKLYSNQS